MKAALIRHGMNSSNKTNDEIVHYLISYRWCWRIVRKRQTCQLFVGNSQRCLRCHHVWYIYLLLCVITALTVFHWVGYCIREFIMFVNILPGIKLVTKTRNVLVPNLYMPLRLLIRAYTAAEWRTEWNASNCTNDMREPNDHLWL